MSDRIMLSLRLPSELARRLETVAATTDRTRTYVATRAIEEYVESEEETLAKIREGVAAADAGETVSHAEALKYVGRLKKTPKPGRPQPTSPPRNPSWTTLCAHFASSRRH